MLSHASQFCDPRIDAEFWAHFNDFEVHHGNEDTFREMLLLKRSVQAQYTEVSLASGAAPTIVIPRCRAVWCLVAAALMLVRYRR